MKVGKSDLMEMSTETLAWLIHSAKAEMERRGVGAEVLTVHAGHEANGQPSPTMVRVLRKLVALPPSEVAKLETLVDAFTSGRGTPPSMK